MASWRLARARLSTASCPPARARARALSFRPILCSQGRSGSNTAHCGSSFSFLRPSNGCSLAGSSLPRSLLFSASSNLASLSSFLSQLNPSAPSPSEATAAQPTSAAASAASNLRARPAAGPPGKIVAAQRSLSAAPSELGREREREREGNDDAAAGKKLLKRPKS